MKITLTVVEGQEVGRVYALEGHDTFVAGRAPAAQLRLPKDDRRVSRNQFLIEVNPPLCQILDLNSRNGTLVNGRSIKRSALADGDLVQVGHTVLRVNIVAVPRSNIPATTLLPVRHASGEPLLQTPATFAPTDSDEPVEHERPTSMFAPRAAPTDVLEDLASAVTGLPHDFRQQIAGRAQPFPGYLLMDELGRGGMGVVYRAICLATRTLVAVKVIQPAVACRSSELARFVREAEILKQVSHPHIVPFRELGHAHGQLFIAMDYVPGQDSQAWARGLGSPVAMRRVLGIACQMTSGLAAAHRAGFVHRDVKPANVLVARQERRERAYLADFGLARAYQASMISGLTMTGDVGGTIPFMPPEQITDYRHVGPVADQYAAAATIYYLLTGQFVHDFTADTGQQFAMILQESPVPLRERRHDATPQLDRVLQRALAPRPEDRFASTGEFRQALVRCWHELKT